MPISNQLTNYTSYKYVVTGSEPGPFHTIQSCLDYVQALGETTTILVRPGTYTENLTLYSGINIKGADEGQVDIIGTHTPPAAGSFLIVDANLHSATDIFFSAAAGTASLTVQNCLIDCTLGYIYNLANWTGDLLIDLSEDVSASNAIVVNTASAAVTITDSELGSALVPMQVTGVTRIFNSRITCPISFALTAIGLVDCGSRINKQVFVINDAEVDIINTIVSSGALTPITHTSSQTLVLNNVILNTSNLVAIDGTGAVAMGEVVFPNSHGIAGTITFDNTSQLQCSQLVANAAATVTAGDVTITNGQLVLGVSGGTNGQVPIAATGANPAWATMTSTDGTINIALGANTIDLSAAGGANWTVATAATAMAATDGYITKIAIPGMLDYTLPAVAAIGTILEVTGYSAGMWRILQNANQQIHFGNVDTTLGAGGSITATNRYDSIRLLCVTANLEWNVLSSTGVFNIV